MDYTDFTFEIVYDEFGRFVVATDKDDNEYAEYITEDHVLEETDCNSANWDCDCIKRSIIKDHMNTWLDTLLDTKGEVL